MGNTQGKSSNCPKCNAMITVGDRFCKSCGTGLNWGPHESAPAGRRSLAELPLNTGCRGVVDKILLWVSIPSVLFGFPFLRMFLLESSKTQANFVGGLCMIGSGFCWIGVVIIGIRILIEKISGSKK